MLQEFTENDNDYQQWAKTHPTGYVINTLRSKPSNNMQLHLATCRHIRVRQKGQPPGAFTERDYIKICADTKAELRQWASEHGCEHLIEKCPCPPLNR